MWILQYSVLVELPLTEAANSCCQNWTQLIAQITSYPISWFLYFYKRWFYVSIKAYCLDHPIYWFLCFYKSQSIKSSKHLGIMGVDTTRIWTPCLRILPRNQATTSKNLTKWFSKACPLLLPVCFASFREVPSLVPHVLEMGVETGCCQNLAGSCL